MRVGPIDPRDCAWEDDAPAYRVYFWHQPGVPAGVVDPAAMYACRELRLTGAADVREVLDWADRERVGTETPVVYVETAAGRDTDVPDAVGLLRIAGADPNAAASRAAGH